MANLKSVLDSLVSEAGAYVMDAPPEWSQGRTLYGGLTGALAAQAANQACPDLPPLRSAQIAFVGPASGRLTFRPQLLRRGRSSTFVAVDCHGEAGLAARALFAHGDDRPSRVTHDMAPPPSVPPPQDCPPFFGGVAPGPAFFQHFEMRLAQGARPFEGAERSDFSVWVRGLDVEGVAPVTALIALADSPPPAAMVAFAQPAPISSMTWSLDISHPVALRGWSLLRSTSEQAADGYSTQAMAVWSDDGRRLAVGRQTVAVFA